MDNPEEGVSKRRYSLSQISGMGQVKHKIVLAKNFKIPDSYLIRA